MSSLVIFERNGVVAEWNKGFTGPYGESYFTVRQPGQPTRYYHEKQKAIAVAQEAAGDDSASPRYQMAPKPKIAPSGLPAASETGIEAAILLARAFGEQIQAAFTVGEFREICDRNKSSHADAGICATHDFTDANMLMLAAFQDTFDREPWFLTDADHPKGEADARLWGDAWAIAKAAEFFA